MQSKRALVTGPQQQQQKAKIKQMTWSVREIIAHLSRLFTLAPGDLVFTGTPAGVGPLTIGNNVRAKIDGLQSLDFSIE